MTLASAGRLPGLLWAVGLRGLQFGFEDEDDLAALAAHPGAAVERMQTRPNTHELPEAPQARALPVFGVPAAHSQQGVGHQRPSAGRAALIAFLSQTGVWSNKHRHFKLLF